MFCLNSLLPVAVFIFNYSTLCKYLYNSKPYGWMTSAVALNNDIWIKWIYPTTYDTWINWVYRSIKCRSEKFGKVLDLKNCRVSRKGNPNNEEFKKKIHLPQQPLKDSLVDFSVFVLHFLQNRSSILLPLKKIFGMITNWGHSIVGFFV